MGCAGEKIEETREDVQADHASSTCFLNLMWMGIYTAQLFDTVGIHQSSI